MLFFTLTSKLLHNQTEAKCNWANSLHGLGLILWSHWGWCHPVWKTLGVTLINFHHAIFLISVAPLCDGVNRYGGRPAPLVMRHPVNPRSVCYFLHPLEILPGALYAWNVRQYVNDPFWIDNQSERSLLKRCSSKWLINSQYGHAKCLQPIWFDVPKYISSSKHIWHHL